MSEQPRKEDAAQPQEWTRDVVIELIERTHHDGFQRVSDAHNAALAAEREKVKESHESLQSAANVCADLTDRLKSAAVQLDWILQHAPLDVQTRENITGVLDALAKAKEAK
jgi:lysine/ornithine N-monooxygenase